MSGVFTALASILPSGAGGWTPAALSPDVWVEAPTTGAAGDRISSHQDIRGGSYPTFTAAGDARPYLGFNDVCHWLDMRGAQGMGTSPTPLHYPTGSFCIAARIRFSAYEANSVFNFEVLIGPRNVGASNSDNEYTVFWNSFDRKFQFQVFSGGTDTTVSANNFGTNFGGMLAPFYSWITVIVWRDAVGGNLNLEINGVAETPSSYSSTINSTSTDFMFGMTEDAAVTSKGHQGAFFVFPSAPDSTARGNIRDYFETKWPNSVVLSGSEAIATLAASSATLWTLNEATFTSSSDRYWKAAAQGSGAYTWCWIQDIWISLQGQEAQATAADLSGIMTRFYAARDGTTSIPVAIEADGTAGTLPRSGGDFVQPDGLCSLILMHKLYYDKSSDLTLFNAQKAVLKTIFLSYPLVDDLLNVTNWCPYGFEDGVLTYGKVSLGSVQFYTTARAFAAMFTAAGDTSDATTLTTYADDMQTALRDTGGPLWDGTNGMFLAATTTSVQIDVLASAYAVYTGAASGTQAGLISDYLDDNFDTLVDVRGYVRQSPINWIDPYDNQFGRGVGNYCDGTWPFAMLWILTAIQVNHPTTAVTLAKRFAGAMATGERTEYFGATAVGYYNQLVIGQGAHAWAQANSGLF